MVGSPKGSLKVLLELTAVLHNMCKVFGFCLLAVIVVLLTWNGTNFYLPHSKFSGLPFLFLFSIYYCF